jgi:hypothetical protein
MYASRDRKQEFKKCALHMKKPTYVCTYVHPFQKTIPTNTINYVHTKVPGTDVMILKIHIFAEKMQKIGVFDPKQI